MATTTTLRMIHCGCSGRGAWPIKLVAEMQGEGPPRFRSVALVDVDKPAGTEDDPVSKPSRNRPSGSDNLATAREASGLGEEVCFLNKFNPDQGVGPAEGLASVQRSSNLDVSGLQSAMASVECDVVAVITPPDTHARFALEAIKAGKHVMVEKPFCKTIGDAVAVVEAAEAAGVKVMVLQNDRYRSGAHELNALVRGGEMGRPAFGFMTRFGHRANVHHSGEDAHSYLWERGIHDLDSIMWAFDSAPKVSEPAHTTPTPCVYTYGVSDRKEWVYKHPPPREIHAAYRYTAHLTGRGGCIHCISACSATRSTRRGARTRGARACTHGSTVRHTALPVVRCVRYM
jgi:predicted dehydrogenase